MKYLTVISTAVLIALPGALGQQCVSQGEGSCQFVMQSFTDDYEEGWPVALFNHKCQMIGFTTNLDPGQSRDSQLPYTVDLLSRGGVGSEAHAVFNYAGGTYGIGHSSYVTGKGSDGSAESKYTWFRAAFPCPGF